MKKLAVIMSVYKKDKYSFLKKAVESVLNQTYTRFDFFIQFDGIIEDSCRNYLLSINDKRIFFRERMENKGLARSLNELLIKDVLPNGYEYIARMDADDISFPERFKKQIDFLESNKDIDCLGSWAIEINEEEQEYFRKKMPSTHKGCYNMFKKRDCLIHPSVVFRRSFFQKAGLYPENTYFGEDTMMWANGFANGCKFSNLSEYLIKFRLDNNFFERRRGWKYATSTYQLRKKVNKTVGYSSFTDIYALGYFIVKLMPKSILDILYKTLR